MLADEHRLQTDSGGTGVPPVNGLVGLCRLAAAVPPIVLKLLRMVAIGIHPLAVLAAVAVPACAVCDAVATLVSPTGAETLAAVVDPGRWLALLANTGAVAGVAVLVACGAGGLLGLATARTDLPGRAVLLGLALFAACVPVYVSTVTLFSLLPDLRLSQSSLACGLAYGLVYTPLGMLILGAAFRSSDRELEEQALLDASPWTVLLRVTVPQAGWGLVVTAMIVILLVATDITITDVLMVRTFAEEVYTQYALDRRRAGPLLTALPVLAVLSILLLTVQARYRLLGEQSPWQLGTRPRVFTLGSARRLAGVACALAIAAGLVVPARALLRHIHPLHGLGAAIAGLQPELVNSAMLASIGATLAVAPAAGLAWSVVRGRRSRWAACAAMVVLLALPAPVVGISLITLLNNPVGGWFYDCPAIVAIAYFVRFLPVAVLLLIPGVQRIPREVEQAARVDGCGWLGEHWHVRCPNLLADSAVAWLVIVILAFAEVGATVLLAPPGWPTASVRAFTLLHFGVYRDLALLALLSTACILLPWALLVWLLQRVRRCPSEPGQ
jgi:iron(III) transport system permease protein